MSCTQCSAGYYSNGTTSCKAASAGHFVSGAGKSTQTQCEIGQYQPNTGQSSCLTCEGGKYTDAKGQTSCKTCEEDHKCTNGKKEACTDATGANAGSSSCSACKPTASCLDCKVPDKCLKCNSKYYISGNTCSQCTAGYSCDGTATRT